MRIMFHMMNEARIGVGVQGLAGAAAAYEFAQGATRPHERIQGSDVAQNFRDPDAERMADPASTPTCAGC